MFPSPDVYPYTSDGGFHFIKTRPRIIQLARVYQSNKTELILHSFFGVQHFIHNEYSGISVWLNRFGKKLNRPIQDLNTVYNFRQSSVLFIELIHLFILSIRSPIRESHNIYKVFAGYTCKLVSRMKEMSYLHQLATAAPNVPAPSRER